MVALHIQLGRGTLEFHFGVFVTLALLLVYSDWRPIVLSAAFFAVRRDVADVVGTAASTHSVLSNAKPDKGA